MDTTEQSLFQFVSTKALPARVKVTEGYQDPQHSDWEFSTGDVIDLRRVVCPTVELSFYDQERGEHRHMSVSTTCPCLFKILPYIPDQPMYLDRPIVLDGVQKLVSVWPALVSTEKKYNDSQRNLSLAKGEKIKLKRLIWKEGEQVLECKLTSKARLIYLPMECAIRFKILADNTAYMLREIGDMPCRVKQRLRLSDDTVNKALKVPGLPPGYDGDLFMEPAKRFVEVSPSDSPGLINAIPIDTDLTVAEREDTYGGMSVRWYVLSQFLEDNCGKLPLVVQLMEWDEEPVSVQAIRASVRDRMVLHHAETVRKMVCQVAGAYYSVPLKFDGRFRLKPRTFYGLDYVVRDQAKKVRVKSPPSKQDKAWEQVAQGDVLRIGNTKIVRKTEGGRFFDETETVTIWKNENKTSALLPLYMEGVYEEIIDIPSISGKLLTLDNLPSTVLPVSVELTEHSPMFPPTKNPLTTGEPITLLFIYQDECILASKDVKHGYTCPVPLSSKISVRYISQFPKTNPIPELSTLSTCPDEISETAVSSLKRGFVYEMPEDPITDRPSLPPRGISSRRGKGTSSLPGYGKAGSGPGYTRGKVPLPPIPDDQVLHALPLQITAPKENPVQHLLKDPPPSVPSRALKRSVSDPARSVDTPGVQTKTRNDEDVIDYEDVGDTINYKWILEKIFGNEQPPLIKIPEHANIHGFSWQEMVTFLQLTNMPPMSMKLFADKKIDGKIFSQLTNEELSKYGVNFPLIRHFRTKSQGATTVKTGILVEL